jgi:UDP-glucuronate 4-epimerase
LYAATKRSNELLAQAYHHLYQQKSIGLRFFTVYGPMGRPDMAYFSFVQKILKGESIPVCNNGDMRRDCTYLDDIVAGIQACLDVDFERMDPLIVNLGNNTPVRLMDFIATIETSLGMKAKIESLGMQPGDVKHTYS